MCKIKSNVYTNKFKEKPKENFDIKIAFFYAQKEIYSDMYQTILAFEDKYGISNTLVKFFTIYLDNEICRINYNIETNHYINSCHVFSNRKIADQEINQINDLIKIKIVVKLNEFKNTINLNIEDYNFIAKDVFKVIKDFFKREIRNI